MKIIYKLEGNTDNNLCVSNDNKVKLIRLLNVEENNNYSFEIISESENGKHEIIDSLLGKKISIEVKILD